MNTLELLEDVVTLGSTAVVLDLETDELEEYTLVPPRLADISRNRISTLTPVAQALYGRSAGETVEVLAPAGPVRMRIESIRREGDVNEYG